MVQVCWASADRALPVPLCLSLPLAWVLEEEPTLEAVECARGPTGGPKEPTTPPPVMGQV